MNNKSIASLLVASALMTSGSHLRAELLTAAPVSTDLGVAPAPISQPIQTKVEVIAKDIAEKTELLEVKAQVPQIVGLSDAHFQAQFNYLRELHATKAIAEAKETLQEMAADFTKRGWPVQKGQIYMNYDVKSVGRILSFTVTNYTYLGGANGLTVVETYNVDIEQNRVITSLDELFADGADYKSAINARIAEQIKERVSAMPASYFEGNMGLTGITESQGFYVGDDSLVIVFPKYSIAPGATGVPEFSIPMAGLKDLLRSVDSKTENATTIITSLVVQDQEIAIKPYTSPKGVTMIPLRIVCQSLGYQVNWNEAGQMIEIFKGAQWTQVFIGQDTYSFAKMLIRLGTAPVIRDDITYVPASFAEQVLRADVVVKDGALIITQK